MVNHGVYVSYEDVKQLKGITASEAAADIVLQRLCRQVSALWDRHTRRRFWPLKTTRYYDYADSWRLWLDDDLLEVTTFTNGDATALTDGTDFLKYPLGQTPHAWLDIKRDSGKVFQYSGTLQRALQVLGIWGYHEDWANAWVDSQDTIENASGITASGTSITVNNVGGADVWGIRPRFKVDQLLKIGSEYLWLTVKDSSLNALTVVRGVNGTTAATHDKEAAIYVYQPMDEVVQAITRWVLYAYSQKDASVFDVTAMPEAGIIQVPQGIPKDVKLTLSHFTQRRYRYGA